MLFYYSSYLADLTDRVRKVSPILICWTGRCHRLKIELVTPEWFSQIVFDLLLILIFSFDGHLQIFLDAICLPAGNIQLLKTYKHISCRIILKSRIFLFFTKVRWKNKGDLCYFLLVRVLWLLQTYLSQRGIDLSSSCETYYASFSNIFHTSLVRLNPFEHVLKYFSRQRHIPTFFLNMDLLHFVFNYIQHFYMQETQNTTFRKLSKN